MTEEEILGVLAQIIEPLTGKWLAEAAAWRLYNELARVDRDALNELLVGYDTVVQNLDN